MRALVSGSTGFIGGALCRALVENSYQVRAFHRETSNLTLLKDLPIEHALGDLTNVASLQKAMEGVDVVFHVAALLGGNLSVERLQAVTVTGTSNILSAARQAGVKRFIHTSSVAALGVPLDAEENQPPSESRWMDENHTWNYRPEYWPYGYSKYLAEMEVQKAVSMGLDAVIVNPSYVIGSMDLYRKTSSIIMKVAQNKLPFGTTGGLNAVHIADVIEGHLAALSYGKCGERYILGGHNVTVSSLIELIAQATSANIPRVIVPGSVLRFLAAPLSILSPMINLPISMELIRLAGYGFYYSREKSQKELKLPAPRPLTQAITEAYEWFLSGSSTASNLIS